MQKKSHSFLESLLKTVVSYIICTGSQFIIFPLYNIEITFADNFKVGAWFMLISIICGYTIRRIFNRYDD